jgi:hypothetical protein
VDRFSQHNILPTSPKLTYLSVFKFMKVCMTGEMSFLNTHLPRHPPLLSRMYTGTSVLTKEPGRHYLPLWNWQI